jgi:hypothetical protein
VAAWWEPVNPGLNFFAILMKLYIACGGQSLTSSLRAKVSRSLELGEPIITGAVGRSVVIGPILDRVGCDKILLV